MKSFRYEPRLQLTENEEGAVNSLMNMGCTRFQCLEAVFRARAAGKPDDFGSIFVLARDAAPRSSIFSLPNGVPIFLDFDPNASEPIEVEKGFWAFQRNCYQVAGADLMPAPEIALRIKHFAYRNKHELERIQQEVEEFARPDPSPTEGTGREHIPQSVKRSVWRRDRCRCVQCGSNVKLEYDHIIPVVKGGSSTERNLQLLCEHCNRKKGKLI